MLEFVNENLLQLWHDLRYVVLILLFIVFVLIRWWQQAIRQKFNESSHRGEEVALPVSTDVTSLEQDRKFSLSVRQKGPIRKITGQKPLRTTSNSRDSVQSFIQPIVFHVTLGRTTEAYAKSVTEDLRNNLAADSRIQPPQLLDLSEIELEEYFTSTPLSTNTERFYIILFPSYDIDTNLSNFLDHLKETHYDFRVDTAPLASLLGYAVLGFGDREGWPTEEEGFCFQAKQVDQWLAKLTAHKRAYPLGTIDVKAKDAQDRISDWQTGVLNILKDLAAGHGLGEGVRGSGSALESDNDEESDSEPTPKPPSRTSNKKSSPTTLDDLENLGTTIRTSAPPPVDFTTPKPMVPTTSPTHATLTKQGYTIVGSHSGVKICRWTKSALRGRGHCYKHSFYGIASHRCMEATPSLSCSNKCVFCWRHGTNPVGTVWRWDVDSPGEIFAGVKDGHYRKIKMLRGVPGVRAERFEEAMRIRHCALSLVGEPIFYPRINELLRLLHGERISSFLVCNAQHPQQLASLGPVTQLYLSVDAADAKTMRKIDRPLHRDFWERFCQCLDIVREKRLLQRTVYRLTLVKGFNADEATGYAELVARGLPGFVEVKGVTYCGTAGSKGAGLTMGNVPFWEEVVGFVDGLERRLREMGLDYGIAAEHQHSCCVLLADRGRFCVDGEWRCCIDYEKFFALLEGESDRQGGYEKVKGIRPEEYMAKTPEWALWGRGGFDPNDERVRKKGKKAREDKLAEAKLVEVVEEE